jgi:hypothetical protein
MSLWATANPTVRQDRGHAEASALALVVEAAQPGPFLFDCISCPDRSSVPIRALCPVRLQTEHQMHATSSNIAFATMPSTESTNKRWLFQHPRPLSTAPPALPHSGRHRPPSGGSPFESPAPARTSPSRAGRTRAPRRGRSASEPGHLFPVIADSSCVLRATQGTFLTGGPPASAIRAAAPRTNEAPASSRNARF